MKLADEKKHLALIVIEESNEGLSSLRGPKLVAHVRRRHQRELTRVLCVCGYVCMCVRVWVWVWVRVCVHIYRILSPAHPSLPDFPWTCRPLSLSLARARSLSLSLKALSLKVYAMQKAIPLQ